MHQASTIKPREEPAALPYCAVAGPHGEARTVGPGASYRAIIARARLLQYPPLTPRTQINIAACFDRVYVSLRSQRTFSLSLLLGQTGLLS